MVAIEIGVASCFQPGGRSRMQPGQRPDGFHGGAFDLQVGLFLVAQCRCRIVPGLHLRRCRAVASDVIGVVDDRTCGLPAAFQAKARGLRATPSSSPLTITGHHLVGPPAAAAVSPRSTKADPEQPVRQYPSAGICAPAAQAAFRTDQQRHPTVARCEHGCGGTGTFQRKQASVDSATRLVAGAESRGDR